MAIVLTPVVPTSMPMTALTGEMLFRAQGLVDDLVSLDRVFVRLRLAERGVIDPRGDRVDETPLEHAPPHSRDRIFCVRVEVEAEALAVVAIARAAQLEGELQRLDERRRAHHVVVVERAPAAVGVLMAEQPLASQHGR